MKNISISGQLQILRQSFQSLHAEFDRISAQLRQLDEEYAKRISDALDAASRRSDSLPDLEVRIRNYADIAADYTPKRISRNAAPQDPDPDLLYRLIDQIDVNSSNDSAAGRIMDLASAYLSYISQQEAGRSSSMGTAVARLEQERDTKQQQLRDRRKELIRQCRAIILSDDMKALIGRFDRLQESFDISPAWFRNNAAQQPKLGRRFMIGFSRYDLDCPHSLAPVVKEGLGEYFDEDTRSASKPCGFNIDMLRVLSAEYTALNEPQLREGLQALIMNYIRYHSEGSFRITLLDSVYYNADLLGIFAPVSRKANSAVESVPDSSAGFESALNILADQYHALEKKLGSETLYQYNARLPKNQRFPYRLLILNTAGTNAFSAAGSLQYLENNACKLGLTIVRIQRNGGNGSRNTANEKSWQTSDPSRISIISDQAGGFHIYADSRWESFRWISCSGAVPSDYLDSVTDALVPPAIGYKYFSRYTFRLPERSDSRKRELVLPFGVDESDNPVSYDMRNENFAAYVMGASGSGKSSLLHTLILSIISNYHPDEAELWLLDFKMVEFKRYVDNCPPHIRYILLEKSPDLVYDILDQMTAELERREKLFALNGWGKYDNVPMDVYMPRIIVIIDEFAQMSQLLMETKGEGYGSDYTIKLENLLVRGRATGFKFIFSSQTYTEGVLGLTEVARKQIQMRFAMKNTYQEIKETLALPSSDISDSLRNDMNTLPVFESLFRTVRDGQLVVTRVRNMFAEDSEVLDMTRRITQAMQPADEPTADPLRFRSKHPVFVEGIQPNTFAGQERWYDAYENATAHTRTPDEFPIYPGVPCSFNLARPFLLKDSVSDNMLTVGGRLEQRASLLVSFLRSCSRLHMKPEIWAHPKDPLFQKYRHTLFERGGAVGSDLEVVTGLSEICRRIDLHKQSILRNESAPYLIIVLGYDRMVSELELAEESSLYTVPDPVPAAAPAVDLFSLFGGDSMPTDEEVAAYVRSTEEQPEAPAAAFAVYDARSDLGWLLKRCGLFSGHFAFFFERTQNFNDSGLKENMFLHKIVFSMSKPDSLDLIGNFQANGLSEDAFLYTDGKVRHTMRPHLHREVPRDGWIVTAGGSVEIAPIGGFL